MSSIHREIALSLYRWATGRERIRSARSFLRQSSFPACILFYHRVADHSMNSWSITSKNFQRHLDWIKEHKSPASLDEIRTTQLLGFRDRPMVAITFDDGYSENCKFAIPYLLEQGVPVTYFVSTRFVETGEAFPHDVEHGVSLRPNTMDEIQGMAKQGIQIGAHTHSHLDLGQPLSNLELRREICDVRKRLQDWTGQPIDYFAFPYGRSRNISQEAVDVVFESGFKCFLSASGGLNWPGQDANHLQRIHGDSGMSAFKNWLTYDPRKIHAKCPIQYELRPKRERDESLVERETQVFGLRASEPSRGA